MLDWRNIANLATIREGVVEASVVVQKYIDERPRDVFLGLGVATAGLLLWKFGPDMRHRYFAWLNNRLLGLKQDEYETFKKVAFASLKDMKSQDPKLREENGLCILEIGAGVGANFNMYPENTHIIVADPNPHFKQYFKEHRAKFPNIKSEKIIVTKGEDIDMIESNSVDAVVTTLVLCSVTDMAKVVSQIKRVLVPGGKYVFVEHVQEWDRTNHCIRKFLQSILSWTGLWPFVFDGCNLNRNPRPIIEAVGFSDIKLDQLYAPMPAAFMVVASPHIRGVATK